jgi:hypothetical protein
MEQLAMDSNFQSEMPYLEVPTLASVPWLGGHRPDLVEYAPSEERASVHTERERESVNDADFVPSSFGRVATT